MSELIHQHLLELLLAIAATLLMVGAALRLPWRAAAMAAILALSCAAGWCGWKAMQGPKTRTAEPAKSAPISFGRSSGTFYSPAAPVPAPAAAQKRSPFTLAGESWAWLLCAFIFAAGAGAAFLSLDTLPHKGPAPVEFFALLIFAALGLTILARSADFVVLFLGLETASIALYCLTATLRDRDKSLEGALKYFILGAVAAAFLLFGVALLYGSTGEFDFSRIFDVYSSLKDRPPGTAANPLLGAPLLMAGLALVLVALSFKAGLAPFHMWAPDAYSGAPTPVAAFMMIATKTAVFAVLLRLGLTLAHTPKLNSFWTALFIVLGLYTLLLGTTIALVQRRIKRLLAYAAISSSGFAALALATLTLQGTDGAAVIRGLGFYLGSYFLATLGLMAALCLVEAPHNLDEELKEFTGLYELRPKFAIAIAILLFSAAGLPGTMGFLGKLFVLKELIAAGAFWPAAIAILMTVVGAAYLLKIIILIFMRPRDPDETYAAWKPGPAKWLIFICAALSLLLGIWPTLGGLIPLP